MVNYIEVISTNHAGVQVSATDPTDYNDINWGSETVIPQATLDAEDLMMYKVAHITAMSAQARATIVNGFESSATGTPYVYDSAQEDQLNMIGCATCGDDMLYPCRIAGVKTYVMHTHAQLLTVVQDGRDVKLTTLSTFTAKQGQILAAVDKAAVDAIVW